MLEHTRKHHTKVTGTYIGTHEKGTIRKDTSISQEDEPMSVAEFLREFDGDLPRWAIVLRGLRNREGLTQSAMGKLLGIPQGNISQMEHGKRAIGKQIAKRLATLFDTDYRLFL